EAAGESEAIVIADHHARGGALEKAVAWDVRAAQDALGANDFATALACAARAVDHGARGEALGEARAIECEAYFWTSAPGDAAARGGAALELCPRGSVSWFRAGGRAMQCTGGSTDGSLRGPLADALTSTPALPGAEGARVAALARATVGALYGPFASQDLADR